MTSSLAVPEQVAAAPSPAPPKPVETAPETPKELIKEPTIIERKEKKQEDSYSIETTKLDVDEKAMGIKNPVIPENDQSAAEVQKAPQDVKAKIMSSKQKQTSDGSYEIETTSMEAADEPATQTAPAVQTSQAPKKPAEAPKKEQKLKQKKKEEKSDFVIETTVATP